MSETYLLLFVALLNHNLFLFTMATKKGHFTLKMLPYDTNLKRFHWLYWYNFPCPALSLIMLTCLAINSCMGWYTSTDVGIDSICTHSTIQTRTARAFINIWKTKLVAVNDKFLKCMYGMYAVCELELFVCNGMKSCRDY